MQAGKFARNIVVENPGQISEWGARFVSRFVGPIVRACFRPTIEGLENLPTDRPYLLVANHSAGVGLAELASFATLWLDHVGTKQRIAGFALPLGFVVWPFSVMHRELGTVPSSYAAAHDALAKGSPLLVFPGGDHESLKPVWQVHNVDFCGRVGFVRIARDANVPIVPIGIRNGAYTAPIVLRSKLLAWLLVVPRLMGVKRWGISLLGLLGCLAIGLLLPASWPIRAALCWLWLGSPLTFLPIFPATLRFRVGEPIEPSELFGSDDQTDDAAKLRTALHRVERAVTNLVQRSPRHP